MKYCLSVEQELSYASKAQELKLDYKDYKGLPEWIERYPEATFIVQIYPRYEDEIDWQRLSDYKVLAHDKLILCLGDIRHMQTAKQYGFKYYYGFPINNFYDLNALKELGVCYFRLEAPAFFEMDKVRKLGVPIRAVANVATLSDISKSKTWCGTWIRPENVSDYEGYVDTIEFEDCDLAKERALYRIYAEAAEWPGDLDMIITNLVERKVCNRLIYSEDLKARISCGQWCQSGGVCRLCMRIFMLANEEKVKDYFEN
ncbi:MAG: hypothetical protein J6Q67_00915, partial [Clostridia bacterium]|nr:hypothetical protein [Clostridia bacterium]